MSIKLAVTKCEPDDDLANVVYINPEDAKKLEDSAPRTKSVLPDTAKYLKINDYVWIYKLNNKVKPNTVWLNIIQRNILNLSNTGDSAKLSVYIPESNEIFMSEITLEINFSRKSAAGDVDTDQLRIDLVSNFVVHCFTLGQTFCLNSSGMTLKIVVKHITTADMRQLATASGDLDVSGSGESAKRGLFNHFTHVIMTKAAGSKVKLVGKTGAIGGSVTFNRTEIDPETMGIGGLNKQFSDIFRRAFIFRMYSQELIEKLGQQHVKGILLYGPPGTGKTLMASKISNMVSTIPPTCISGPSILNKYVGQSEENIRELFAAAENDTESNDLHVIVIDEIDAICRARGTVRDGTGTGDSIVNQLLDKMDGVKQLNNVLVIGMTNRKDMIDEALLRPGRFEVKLEIGLPDYEGRISIFKIHTRAMKESKFLADDVDLEELAKLTKNFSGSEISGLVRSATSFALGANVKTSNVDELKKTLLNESAILIKRVHFMEALKECRASFGSDDKDLMMLKSNGIIPFGSIDDILHNGSIFANQVRSIAMTPKVSILIHGEAGNGMTALAVEIAMRSEFPFIKVLSSDRIVGFPDWLKNTKIGEVFNDAYKSEFSVVILDNIESLIEFSPVGLRFNSSILSSIQNYLCKEPPEGHKLLIIGTTKSLDVLQEFQVANLFNSLIKVPQVNVNEIGQVLNQLKGFSDDKTANESLASELSEEMPLKSIPIKKLIFFAANSIAQEIAGTKKHDELKKLLIRYFKGRD